MDLQPDVKVDLKARFRKELKKLPKSIRLEGNPMQQAIAERLITQQAGRHFTIGEGEPVQLMSLEAYTARFLAVFLEGKAPLQGHVLLHTIPEQELLAYAKKCEITCVEEEKTSIRLFLERITKAQPQSCFSLLKSADRLSEHLQQLPE